MHYFLFQIRVLSENLFKLLEFVFNAESPRCTLGHDNSSGISNQNEIFFDLLQNYLSTVWF